MNKFLSVCIGLLRLIMGSTLLHMIYLHVNARFFVSRVCVCVFYVHIPMYVRVGKHIYI